MSYTIVRLIPDTDMAVAEARTRAALAARGFGVLTEIDVAATMKAKLGKDMDGYRILGACNPGMAFAAIGMEPRVGAMLPCNVIVQDLGNGQVEIAAIDPAASMERISQPELTELARTVRVKLQAVLNRI